MERVSVFAFAPGVVARKREGLARTRKVDPSRMVSPVYAVLGVGTLTAATTATKFKSNAVSPLTSVSSCLPDNERSNLKLVV